MDKERAIELMFLGVKMTHIHFSKEEWVTMVSGTNTMLTNEGYETVSGEWWDHRRAETFNEGWSLWEEDVIVEVDGKSYVYVRPQAISRNLRKIDSITRMFTGESILPRRPQFTESDLTEFKLIQQKKSNLSRKKREYIVYLFNRNFKLIKDD